MSIYYTQWPHNVTMIMFQHQSDVTTSHWCQIDIISMLCAYWAALVRNSQISVFPFYKDHSSFYNRNSLRPTFKTSKKKNQKKLKKLHIYRQSIAASIVVKHNNTDSNTADWKTTVELPWTVTSQQQPPPYTASFSYLQSAVLLYIWPLHSGHLPTTATFLLSHEWLS